MHESPATWHPTRTSTALVVATSVLTAGVLALVTDVAGPAVVGALGALTMAVLVWAAGWEQYRAVGNLVASLLVLPVGVAIAATTFGTVLVLGESLFPVPVAAQIPATAVQLIARASVVVGASVAVFGATTAARGVLDTETVRRAASTATKTTVVPVSLALVLATQAALAFLASTAAGPGPGQVLGGVVADLSRALFEPTLTDPHLSTFVLLSGAALLALHYGLSALPLTELIPDGPAYRDRRVATERGERWLRWSAVAVLTLFPVVTLVEIGVGPTAVRDLLGPGGYDLLAALTTASVVRTLAWWTAVLGAGVAGVVWFLRRFARASADRIGSTLAPVAGGVAITAVALLTAKRVLTRAIQWVTVKLPGQFGTEFASLSASVVDVYGPGTVVLGGVAALVGLAAGTVSLLWLVVATDYVAERTAGATIASLALFTTAAFAGVLETTDAAGPAGGFVTTSRLVVLGALVAAILVWDAGEYGVTMGREVGRRASTRRVELVHATGTLAVGSLAVGATVVLADRAVGSVTTPPGPAALGIVVGVGALVTLVVALR